MKFWDSSAIVSLLVTEADSAARAAALRSDASMAVWWGSVVECESALQRRYREGSLDVRGVGLARENLARLADAWHEILPTAIVRTLAVRLLRTHPLRDADALQLAAALYLVQSGLRELGFITADARLAAAADIEGLTVPR